MTDFMFPPEKIVKSPTIKRCPRCKGIAGVVCGDWLGPVIMCGTCEHWIPIESDETTITPIKAIERWNNIKRDDV